MHSLNALEFSVARRFAMVTPYCLGPRVLKEVQYEYSYMPTCPAIPAAAKTYIRAAGRTAAEEA